MSNSEIPNFCNLNANWFEREKGEKMFYFIDDDLNPRVSKFKKSKENITYNLENKRRTFEIKPRKGKKSKKIKIKKIFKNLKKSLKKRVDASIIENIIDDFGGNKINLKKLSGSVRRKISKKYCEDSASNSSNKNTRKTKKKRRSLFDYLPKLRRTVDKKQNIPQPQQLQNTRNNQIKLLQQQISNLKQEMKKNNSKSESKDNSQNKKSNKEVKMQQEINALKQIIEKGEKERQISKNDMQAYKEKLEYKRKLKSELENERKRMKEDLYRRESKQNKKLREYQRRMNEIQDKEKERKIASKIKGKYKELLLKAEQNKIKAERKAEELKKMRKTQPVIGTPVRTQPEPVVGTLVEPQPQPQPVIGIPLGPQPVNSNTQEIQEPDSELYQLCQRQPREQKGVSWANGKTNGDAGEGLVESQDNS